FGEHRGEHVGVRPVLATGQVDGVGPAVAGQVDDQDPGVPGQSGEVAAEVAPAGGSGSPAVDAEQHLRAGAGLVVVQAGAVDRDEAGGGLAGRGGAGERLGGHQTFTAAGISPPKKSMPYAWYSGPA